MTSKLFPPVVKWTGSKRLQAASIVGFFPKFDKYYEPFVGGGSVLFQANPKVATCGDICEPLIGLWRIIQSSPEVLIRQYTFDWNKLQTEGYQVYYEIRDRFNKNKSPLDLFFLSRTCVNGLIRFNSRGEFNNSLHHTRRGVHPDKASKIIMGWSRRIRNVRFVVGDYREITKEVKSADFVYLDPPYFNTRGRYYGKINYAEFIEFLELLNEKKIKFALSYDGICGNREYVIDLPKHIYKRHFFLGSGNSPFKKVMMKKKEMVRESLYLNW